LTFVSTLRRIATMGQRLSFQALRVLRSFLNRPTDELTGAEIVRASGMASGTVYPLLLRFERNKLLESRWEVGDPVELGRPRRRYYKITAHGQAVVREALHALDSAGTVLSPEAV
jgi:DNA-binding PadR family transcriptional regulator